MLSKSSSTFTTRTVRTLRTAAIILTSMFLGAATGLAQDLDMDCRPIVSVPPQCQQIAKNLKAREDFFSDKIESLKDQALEASPAKKKQLNDQIKALEGQRDHDWQLAQLRGQLQTCRAQYDHTQRRQEEASELDASFVGQAQTNTTNPNARGPFFVNLSPALRFSKNRCVITIISFPAVSFKAPTPIGDVAVNVTMSGGGTGQFFPISGELRLPITLHFHYDSVFTSDDDATMILTTENSVSPTGAFNLNGSRLSTAHGTRLFANVTIVAGTKFQNGFLGGSDGGFTISGKIGPPLPPPPPRPKQCPIGRKCCERAADGSCTTCVANNGRCP